MLKLIKKIFGDKYEKDLKMLWPIVQEINTHYETIKNFSDVELKNKTIEFKEKIQTHTEETRKQISDLKTRLQSDEDFDRNKTYDELDVLEDKLNEEYEEILDELLPEAFAVVKST